MKESPFAKKKREQRVAGIVREVIKLYKDGFSTRDIGRMPGVRKSHTWVWQRVKHLMNEDGN